MGDCIADMLLETSPGDAFGTTYFADGEEEAEVMGVGPAGHGRWRKGGGGLM